ncbi:MurR/RpiR family transcriptional regulator [Roseobacter denitrificans]|uniref:Transcriptional regulator, RpiR family, putative n=1 Tax=Roseobacter denitrificans (strain ATCC 33942 / OCh 114) TaxID=375451 RepID=Q16A62_ROSDO|nr:MurR/RpiR family transcriptional regulator [Roseobacter denitrificans]ABG31131.1 transcriptional regulator, RpiR family, putative [Roseobacter denitrificans OCh 114]AVL54200.1 MurR/RpiR family transcriptional regulator [Roseobacter denitrificans]SFG32478.1 transcriptional regulator, RpiR family [Roseobacter denitrificans OCh 114]
MPHMQIRYKIEQASDTFTKGERKLAAAILSDYPYAGLSSIQDLAKRSEVSAPSISRFMTKIGLSGYQEFHRALIAELKDGDRSPVEMHVGDRHIEGDYLSDFLAKASAQMAIAGDAITEEQFNRVCALLANPKHSIYVIGGRISDTIAAHLSFHLRQARRGVYHLPSDPETWPEYLLRMKGGDIFFVVDFRRYQKALASLAGLARNERGARVVVMTDKWISPVARHASDVLPVPIESGTLWDTYSSALAITEAIVTRIAEDNWAHTKDRIESWDKLRVTKKDSIE